MYGGGNERQAAYRINLHLHGQLNIYRLGIIMTLVLPF